MARAATSDYLQSFRFHVDILRGIIPGLPRLDDDVGTLFDETVTDANKPAAGFNACSLPELSLSEGEYKEGTFLYTRKQPGIPSMSSITLSRGVTRKSNAFYLWMRATAEGLGEYRENIRIQHMARDGALFRDAKNDDGVSAGKINMANATPVRTYTLYHAYPTRFKSGTDLDGTSSEISIQELEFSYEYFTIENAEGNEVGS